MQYGVVGLGELGGKFAANLQKFQKNIWVYDRNEAAMAPLVDSGAKAASSVAELGENCDAVITCLPSPSISQAVITELFGTLKAGSTWIETSTISRDDVLNFNQQAEAAQIRMLEMPVTGGVHLAARGEITLLLGGDQALFDQHHDALKFLGDRIFHMGPIGSASIIKVITNMLAFIHLQACSEALMLAKRAGLDLDQSYKAIEASSGNSFVHETEGKLILSGSYDVGFNMDLALKDLGFARQFGREYESPLELAAIVEQTYVKARAAYGGDAQSPMIAKLMEDLLQTDLRAEGYPTRLV
ncbi:MAG: NAD(P)-dependent oxidoreductase [Gammaproteobacteria bacterium]|nr:NAD(P)-dependent oxidoreductase [Gammaproteobacteria bacterium]